MTERQFSPLCGDPTCGSWSCTQQARDGWAIRQENDARQLFGRPSMTLDEEIVFLRHDR